MLPIAIIGVAIFFMAFLGVNKFFPTIIGLAAIIGLIFGLYFVWLGLSGSNESLFSWGCVLMIASGGVLIVIKTSFSD